MTEDAGDARGRQRVMARTPDARLKVWLAARSAGRNLLPAADGFQPLVTNLV
jgi:hypothetical protein